MKRMTEYQRTLVEQNMSLVDEVIRYKICVKGAILLTREDFDQVGCEALCRAAICYQPKVGEFIPFAKRIIYNAMIDHCRRQNRNTENFSVDAEETFECFKLENLAYEDDSVERISAQDAAELIDSCKEQYTGVARLGVEALELKSLGYSTTEIAQQYKTDVKNVNAWISKARSKLREEPLICAHFAEYAFAGAQT